VLASASDLGLHLVGIVYRDVLIKSHRPLTIHEVLLFIFSSNARSFSAMDAKLGSKGRSLTTLSESHLKIVIKTGVV
jgi:hypothetical protein